MNDDELLCEAQDLSNALNGLASFVFERVSGPNITRDDLSGLQGLIASIHSLSVSHSENMLEYVELKAE